MSDIQGTPLYKMSGAGNDFVVLDGRGVDASEFRSAERIRELCAEFRTDGLMILLEGLRPSGRTAENGPVDFRMEFFNPDGSGGMMCGNGGRCIVAFADWLGIIPSNPDHYTFLAPDGIHVASILSRPEGGRIVVPCGTPFASCTPQIPDLRGPRISLTPAPPIASDGPLPLPLSRGGQARRGLPSAATQWTVRLQMINVDGVQEMLGGYFLNTGTRHFVKFVEDVDAIDVAKEGKELRWNEAFAPEGTNVNFVQRMPDGTLKIRTFEKGVEGETLACGTGITAAALAAWFAGILPGDTDAGHSDGQCRDRRPLVGHGTALCPSRLVPAGIRLQARRGDILSVDFIPDGPAKFHDIHLTGPAELL